MSSFRGLLVLVGALNFLEGGLCWASAPLKNAADVQRAATGLTDVYGDPLPPQAVRRLGTVRFRPPGRVYSLAFSPDGKMLISIENARSVHRGDRTGAIRFWDAQTGRELRHISTSFQEFSSVAFSPHGEILVGCGARGPVSLWDPATGRLTRIIPGSFEGFAFSPDGNTLALVDVGVVGFWEVATGKELRRIEVPRERFLSVAFAPDGKLLAAGDGRFLYLWEVAGGRQLFRLEPPPGGGATAVAFSPDGRTVAAGGPNINLWDTKTGKLQHSLESAGPRFAFSPDGKFLFSIAASSRLEMWEVTGGKKLDRFPGWASCLALSPDGLTLASAGVDASIRLWKVVSAEERVALEGHHFEVYSVVYSPDARMLASGGAGNKVRLWDTGAGQQLREFELPWPVVSRRVPYKDPLVSCLAFSPDGKLLACQSACGLVVWELASGKEVFEKTTDEYFGGGLAFAPNGRTLASSESPNPVLRREGIIRLWDLTGRRPPQALRAKEAGASRGYRCVAFAPDGKTLAAGASDGTLHFWNAKTGEEIRSIQTASDQVGAMAYSPDGTKLAWTSGKEGDRNQLALCDLTGDQPPEHFPVIRGSRLAGIAFSHDGKTLACGEVYANSAQLWEVASRQLIAELRGHQAAVFCVAFSSDGRSLVSAGGDTTVLVWDLLAAAPGTGRRPEQFGPADLDRLWSDLAGDAPGAYRALGSFVRMGQRGILYIEEHLPLTPSDIKDPERFGRAIQALERIGSEEASHVLETIGKQGDVPVLARDARAALARLAARRLKPVWPFFGPEPLTMPKELLPRAELLRLRGHAQAITVVAFSPDGRTLATADLGGEIRLWALPTGEMLRLIPAPKGGVFALAWPPSGRSLVAGCGDHRVRFWDPATGAAIRQLDGHQDAVAAVAFSPDGRTLASGGYDGTVRFWDAVSGRALHRIRVGEGRVTAVAFSPDSGALATGGTTLTKYEGGVAGQADEVRLWEAATGRLVRKLSQRGSAVGWTPEGWAAAAAGRSFEVERLPGPGRPVANAVGFVRFALVDVTTGQEWLGISSRGTTFALSADGRALATGTGSDLHFAKTGAPPALPGQFNSHRVTLWETASGRELFSLAQRTATALAFSPDAVTLAAGTTEGPVIVWRHLLDGGGRGGAEKVFEPQDLVRLANDLRNDNPAIAYRAIWELARGGQQVVAFLGSAFQPPPELATDRLMKLAADLEADDFSTREAASRELATLGVLAEPALRKAVASSSPEVKKRATELLTLVKRQPPVPASLGWTRAMRLLEFIATTGAQEVLQKWAQEPALSQPAYQASEALKRLNAR